MNYFPYLIFLTALSSLGLTLLCVIYLLDYANVNSRQKIMVIRVGLLLIGFSPVIFNFLKLFTLRTVEIVIPWKITYQPTVATAHAVMADLQIQWPFYFLIAYGVGLVVMLSRILSSYVSARRQLEGSIPAVIQEYPVLLNEHVQSPMGFGFPVARIYLPADAEKKWTSRELQMILAHEKSHIDRYDSLWKLWSLVVQAILFFVPWSYALHKKFELEMEIFCDEKTCIETHSNTQEYGRLLLAIVSIQPQNLIFTNMTDSTIKRRLIAMKAKKMKRPLLVSICSVFILLTGSATIAMTSGMTEKETVFKLTSKFYDNGTLVSSPQIVTLADHKATIQIADNISTKDNHLSMSGNSLKLELIPRDVLSRSNDAIGVNYDIQYQNGKEKLHSKNQIVVKPKQESTIRFSSTSGHAYEFRIVAERQ